MSLSYNLIFFSFNVVFEISLYFTDKYVHLSSSWHINCTVIAIYWKTKEPLPERSCYSPYDREEKLLPEELSAIFDLQGGVEWLSSVSTSAEVKSIWSQLG